MSWIGKVRNRRRGSAFWALNLADLMGSYGQLVFPFTWWAVAFMRIVLYGRAGTI